MTATNHSPGINDLLDFEEWLTELTRLNQKTFDRAQRVSRSWWDPELHPLTDRQRAQEVHDIMGNCASITACISLIQTAIERMDVAPAVLDALEKTHRHGEYQTRQAVKAALGESDV